MFLIKPFENTLRELSGITDPIEHFFNTGEVERLPKINLQKGGDEYLLQAELPGYKQEDINLEIEKDYITLSAKLNTEKNEEKENFIQEEIFKGEFKRMIQLSHEVNPEKVEANLENGILYVKLPVVESQKPKKIQVSVK